MSFSAAVAGSPGDVSDRVAATFDAVHSGDCTKLRELLDGHPELLRALDSDGETLLHVAVLARRPEAVRALLSAGAPVDERDAAGYTPLAMVAWTSGSMELLLPLVEKGAQLDAEDRWRSTVLDLAEKCRRHEMTGYLLAQILAARVRQPEPRHDGMTMLHRAASCGLVDAIGPLVDAGLPVNGTTTSGWTPLHFAAEQGHANAVLVLLQQGARIDARVVDGSTAYNLATEMGRGEVADVLAARGADTREPVFPVLEGAYFGMRAPLQSAEPLATGIVAASPPGGFGEIDIYRTRVRNGEFEKPVNLGPTISGAHGDATPFIAPDGSYLLFTRFLSSSWSLFESFRTPDGGWSQPADLGSSLEFPGKRNIECPLVTRDGRTLLFTAEVDNAARPYWVSASILVPLRRELLGTVE